LIAKLRQKDTSLGSEAAQNWQNIVDNELGFDTREKNIRFIEEVTLDDVYQLFNEMVFEAPRRINLRLYNHKHHDDTQTRGESIEINKEFYAKSELFGGELQHKTIDSIKDFQK